MPEAQQEFRTQLRAWVGEGASKEECGHFYNLLDNMNDDVRNQAIEYALTLTRDIKHLAVGRETRHGYKPSFRERLAKLSGGE